MMNKSKYKNIIEGVSLMAEEYYNKYSEVSSLFIEEEENGKRNTDNYLRHLCAMNESIGAWKALNQVIRVLKSKAGPRGSL